MNGSYNIISEYIVLTYTLVILFMMKVTNPRKTKIYIFDYLGIILSIIEISLNRIIIYLSLRPMTYNHYIFDALCLIFFTIYTVLCILIFAYVDQLSYKHRTNTKSLKIISTMFFTISMTTYSYLIFTGKMYTSTYPDIAFTQRYSTFLIFGIASAAIALIITIINRTTIAKRMRHYVYIAVLFEFMLLYLQYKNHSIIFTSFTYATPFIIYYLLFHSNPYDEVSGCQNVDSFITRFNENIQSKKKFMIVTMTFPTYKHMNGLINTDLVNQATAEKCHQMQEIYRNIYLYQINPYTFTLFVNIDDKKAELQLLNQIKDIMSTPVIFYGRPVTPVYKMIVYKNSDNVNNFHKLSSFEHFLSRNFSPELINEYYIATPKDYDDFNDAFKIEQILQQINTTKNLDDPHVLCYAQPIFNVKKNGFRTAEALMRMQIDEKMVFPDKFIPLAEKTNCIHVLTLIMLNKVCKEITNLSGKYDFDAITVNCSTLELADPSLHKELLQIIHDNEVDTSKICLELTESAMINDYDIIQNNIYYLRKEGVQFYLDDFGTGYSNLERIITCPFKTIKFDKSLLYKSMDDNSVNDLLVSMVDVFKRQGFQLLVEGVEDNVQNDYSIEKGFDYIQGYKYSKPIPIKQLTDFFEKV